MPSSFCALLKINRGLRDAVLSLYFLFCCFLVSGVSFWCCVGIPASDRVKPSSVHGKYGRNILSTYVKKKEEEEETRGTEK